MATATLLQQSSSAFGKNATYSQIVNSSSTSRRRPSSAIMRSMISVNNLQSKGFPDILQRDNVITTTPDYLFPNISVDKQDRDGHNDEERLAIVLEKMHAVMDAAEERSEMHRNVGEQRDNWNALLLSSLNSMTLAAATMSALSAAVPDHSSALRIGAVALYVAATGISSLMSKLQPSQLAEEQRNAARLFQQLRREIKTKISLGRVSESDVADAAERVLALDKAFPLPLLDGAMLEKFPEKVEPAVWWPSRRSSATSAAVAAGGWTPKLEEEMREIGGVIERRDSEEYLKLGEKALKLNRILAVSGPVLSGIAAVGTAVSGHVAAGAVVGVLGGALASFVSSVEHGGQVGMVFEMYRNNAGFFKLLEETIDTNVRGKRENGEVLEMKIALQLGRSVSDLKSLARKPKTSEEFASKLF